MLSGTGNHPLRCETALTRRDQRKSVSGAALQPRQTTTRSLFAILWPSLLGLDDVLFDRSFHVPRGLLEVVSQIVPFVEDGAKAATS